MGREVRVGVVGCGGIANAHLGGYQKAGDIRVASVYDPRPEAAKAFAEKTGATVAESIEVMIERDRVDAVSVCSPPAAHLENCRPFLRAGVAVLCEKPLERDGARAAKLAALAKRSRTVFMVAFCHRFHPGIVALKELIDAGTLGAPVLFRNIFGGYVNLEGNHRADPKLSGGGCLIDHCAHSVDLFRFLVGEPREAQAFAGNVLQKIPVEDFGMIQLKTAGGAYGEITASYSLKVCGNWVEWYGTKGTAVVSYWNDGHPDLAYRIEGAAAWTPVDCAGRPDRFAGEVGAFLAAVRAGGPPPVTVADGLRANRIADAIYKAAKTGRRAKIAAR